VFAAQTLEACPSQKVEAAALYERYRQWCEEGGKRPMRADRFVKTFASVCREAGFKCEKKGGRVWVVDAGYGAIRCQSLAPLDSLR